MKRDAQHRMDTAPTPLPLGAWARETPAPRVSRHLRLIAILGIAALAAILVWMVISPWG